MSPRKCGHEDVIISKDAIEFVREQSGNDGVRKFFDERMEEANIPPVEGTRIIWFEDEKNHYIHGPVARKSTKPKSAHDKYREGWDNIFGGEK